MSLESLDQDSATPHASDHQLPSLAFACDVRLGELYHDNPVVSSFEFDEASILEAWQRVIDGREIKRDTELLVIAMHPDNVGIRRARGQHGQFGVTKSHKHAKSQPTIHVGINVDEWRGLQAVINYSGTSEDIRECAINASKITSVVHESQKTLIHEFSHAADYVTKSRRRISKFTIGAIATNISARLGIYYGLLVGTSHVEAQAGIQSSSVPVTILNISAAAIGATLATKKITEPRVERFRYAEEPGENAARSAENDYDYDSQTPFLNAI